MSVHDAAPGDLYVDANGKLWRVVGVCGEPTVIVQEVESSVMNGAHEKKSGGVGGFMWQGFKRIHRPDPPKADQHAQWERYRQQAAAGTTVLGN